MKTIISILSFVVTIVILMNLQIVFQQTDKVSTEKGLSIYQGCEEEEEEEIDQVTTYKHVNQIDELMVRIDEFSKKIAIDYNTKYYGPCNQRDTLSISRLQTLMKDTTRKLNYRYLKK